MTHRRTNKQKKDRGIFARFPFSFSLRTPNQLLRTSNFPHSTSRSSHLFPPITPSGFRQHRSKHKLKWCKPAIFLTYPLPLPPLHIYPYTQRATIFCILLVLSPSTAPITTADWQPSHYTPYATSYTSVSSAKRRGREN
mmetsp:Transcript_50042/g.128804  ORF Transcript_50042/g.128804 Transcript_50042/m.128804 type:complete len:139 (+) Transcript_50042:123-539(+)